jgi:hypothetical protein
MTETPGSTGSGGASAGGAQHGSLSEEALKLAETLQTWLSTGAAMTGVGSASECKVCPLCQAIAMVNGLKPEVLGHLAEAGTQLMAAFRSATDKADADNAERTGTPDRAGTADRGGNTGQSWASSDRPPVQHIPVT